MSTSPAWSDWPGRGRQRIAEVVQAAEALRARIDSWLASRRNDERFARFTGHFDVLGQVLTRMLDRIQATLDTDLDSDLDSELDLDLDLDLPAGPQSSIETYRRCREIEEPTVRAAEVSDWYASKYDQRLGPTSAVLAAADQLVRSCWTQTYAALGLPATSAPLPYLDARFDALATPRLSIPSDLRAPEDAAVADCVLALPPATIALPMHAADRGWWLVLIAHEVGHHVCTELGLEPSVRSAIRAAGAAPENPLPYAELWNRWCLETFADVYSVLMVGGAAGWALAELQHAEPADLARPPSMTSRYPAPLVRLAVIGETARQAGIPSAVPDAVEALAWLDAVEPDLPSASSTATAEHLAGVPSVVACLLALPLSSATTLLGAAGTCPEWFAPGGRIGEWARQLRGPSPMTLGKERREAARQAVAAGVTAYDALARTSGGPPPAPDVRQLHENLVGLLAECGGPGVLAAAPIPSQDLESLADRLADRLLEAASASESARRRTDRDRDREVLDVPSGVA